MLHDEGNSFPEDEVRVRRAFVKHYVIDKVLDGVGFVAFCPLDQLLLMLLMVFNL